MTYHVFGRISDVLKDVEAIIHECQWPIVLSSGGWNHFEVVMNTIMNYSVVWTMKSDVCL